MENNLLLVGKSINDFFNYHYKGIKWTGEDVEHFYEDSFLVCYGYILDWFDSVGLKVGIEPIYGGDFRVYVLVNNYTHNWIDERFDNRTKAMIEAIKKASAIYNSSEFNKEDGTK